MSYQITIFDVIVDNKPVLQWQNMTLKQIAAYISEKTGLNFIPDTRFKGEFNEYIAYATSNLFFTVGISKYTTLDTRNGRKFISVCCENKKDLSGEGHPCDTIEDAIEFFKNRRKKYND